MFGWRPLPRNLDAAIRDLGSQKVAVRIDALRDLTRHAEEHRDRVIEGATKALKDTDATVRAAAATALADIEAKEAVEALLEASDDRDAVVAQMAVAALGEVGDKRAAPRLRKALDDRRPEVRFQAVIGFPRLAKDREEATLALLVAMRDDDELVAHVALRMAEELETEAAEKNRDHAVDPRIVARAQNLVEHGAPMVKVAAAILLARDGNAKAKAVLVQVARGDLTTKDGGDEAQAIELCGELALEAATNALEKRAFSGVLGFMQDRCAWHARVALARMGHERATREIVAELSSWNRDRRTLAVAAVGRARIRSARSIVSAMKGDEQRADPDAVREALAELAR